MRLPKSILAVLGCIILTIPVGPSQAQDATQAAIVSVDIGARQKIDKFGVCRVVGNSGGTKFMVPSGTEREWSSGPNAFLNNLTDMDGTATVSPCVRRLLKDDGIEHTTMFSAPNPAKDDWATLYDVSSSGRYILAVKDKYGGAYGDKKPVVFIMEIDGTDAPVTIWQEQASSQRRYVHGYISENGNYFLLSHKAINGPYNAFDWTIYRKSGSTWVRDAEIGGAYDTRPQPVFQGEHLAWIADDGSEFRWGRDIFRRSNNWNMDRKPFPTYQGRNYMVSHWTPDGRYAWLVAQGTPWPWTAQLAEWNGTTWVVIPEREITSSTINLTSAPPGGSGNHFIVQGSSLDNEIVMLSRPHVSISFGHKHIVWFVKWNGSSYEFLSSHEFPTKVSNNISTMGIPTHAITKSGDAISVFGQNGGHSIYHSIKEDKTYDHHRIIYSWNNMQAGYYSEVFVMNSVSRGTYAEDGGTFDFIPPVRND